jgi:nicotinamidase-related amidase
MRVRSRTRNQGPQSNCDEAPNHAPAIRNEVSSMTPFLLLVDLQHDYLRAAGLEPAAGQIVDRAAVLLQGCRAASIPVAHVWTTVSRADDQRMPHWKRLGKWICEDGTPGHAPPAPLRPEASEPVIHKRFFSAFSSGTLAPMLTARGVDTLIVAGIHLHGCVRQTVFAAYEKGFDIWVADDAVGSDDPLHAAITRRYLQSRAARFASVAELLAMLKNGPTEAPTTAPAPCSQSTKTM